MKFTTLAVAAGLVAAPAVLGAPAAMQERNLYIEKLDDHSAVYTGKWTNLVQQGLGTFEQTLSYTKEKNACVPLLEALAHPLLMLSVLMHLRMQPHRVLCHARL